MQLSFRLGVIFILLAAAAWGLGGVAGQFLFQFYDVGAPWLIADHCRRGLFRLSAVSRREYLGSAAG
jgi:hypothetical protein